MPRDPRVQPVPGDVLERQGRTGVIDRVVVDVSFDSAFGPLTVRYWSSSFSLGVDFRWIGLRAWREWATGARVVRRMTKKPAKGRG